MSSRGGPPLMSAEVLGCSQSQARPSHDQRYMSSLLSLGSDILQELALVVARRESGTVRDVAHLALTCHQLYDLLWLGTEGYWIHLSAADGRGKALSAEHMSFAQHGRSLTCGSGRNVLPRLESALIVADGKLPPCPDALRHTLLSPSASRMYCLPLNTIALTNPCSRFITCPAITSVQITIIPSRRHIHNLVCQADYLADLGVDVEPCETVDCTLSLGTIEVINRGGVVVSDVFEALAEWALEAQSEAGPVGWMLRAASGERRCLTLHEILDTISFRPRNPFKPSTTWRYDTVNGGNMLYEFAV